MGFGIRVDTIARLGELSGPPAPRRSWRRPRPQGGVALCRVMSFSYNLQHPFLRLGEGHQDRDPIVLTLAWPLGFW